MKHFGLFEGIGGFALAAEWAGIETVGWCEWSSFCQKILSYHFPNAIPHADITKTDFTIYRGLIDILTGGFPCQGFSVAGNRMGTDDDRYLWPEMFRAVKEIRPPYIIGENVTGIISMEDKSGVHRDVFLNMESRNITRLCEIDRYEAIYTRQAKMLINSICEDLEKEGYEVQPLVIPAASVKAPHKRDRVWFIAYSNRFRFTGGATKNNKEGERATSNSKKNRNRIFTETEGFSTSGITANTNSNDARGCGHGKTGQKKGKNQDPEKEWERLWGQLERIGGKRNVANPNSTRCEESTELSGNTQHNSIIRSSTQGDATDPDGFRLRGKSNRTGKPGFISETGAPNDWRNFPVESPVLPGNDGFSAQLDGITFSKFRSESLKGAGNAVVPQIPYQFYQIIIELEKLLSNE